MGLSTAKLASRDRYSTSQSMVRSSLEERLLITSKIRKKGWHCDWKRVSTIRNLQKRLTALRFVSSLWEQRAIRQMSTRMSSSATMPATIATNTYIQYLPNMQITQLLAHLPWLAITLQGVLLLADPYIPNRQYGTFAPLRSIQVTFVRNLIEHLRLALSLSMLPTVFYRQSWTIFKFISLAAYVAFLSVTCNLLEYQNPNDFKYLLIHLLILMDGIQELVKDIEKSQNQQLEKKGQ